jgi:hypothetical protein
MVSSDENRRPPSLLFSYQSAKQFKILVRQVGRNDVPNTRRAAELCWCAQYAA